MKIIEQSHEILAYDGLGLIEMAGRTCYKSEDKTGCTVPNEPCERFGPGHLYLCPCAQDDCEFYSSQRFVRQLIKRGHEAMLEHGVATVKFVTNRGVTHELVRHRVASFGQESTRYVKYDDVEFIRPVWLDMRPSDPATLGADVEFLESCTRAEKSYRILIGLGWRPEQAREVLPNALKTEIVVTANYREWRHILKLRAIGTTGKPHPQMQALMLPLLAEFKERLPALFEDLEVK